MVASFCPLANWRNGVGLRIFMVSFSCWARLRSPRSEIALGFYFDLLVVKNLVVFVGAAEQERIRHLGLPLRYGRDDVTTTVPVRFVEVSLRPLRRMVGMRVIEPDDLQVLLPSLALCLDELLRGNVVTVMRGVGACVARAHQLYDFVFARDDGSSQHDAAALVGIGLLPVLTHRVVLGLFDLQHLLSPEPFAQILVRAVAEDGHDDGFPSRRVLFFGNFKGRCYVRRSADAD